jgi:large repetitive protein
MLKWVILGILLILLSFGLSSAQAASISSGKDWLIANQNADKSWGNATSAETPFQSTTEAIKILKLLNSTGTPYSDGLNWLNGQPVDTANYSSNKLLALANSGFDQTNELNSLLSMRNDIAASWGLDSDYANDILETAFALQALKAANYSDQAVIFSAINYLLSAQNTDGGWGFVSDSTVYITTQVLYSLAQYKNTYLIPQQISTAATFLLSKQNPDGGFGSNGSTVYETALALIVLIESGQTSALPLQNALVYLTTTQSANGSWNDDPYPTALALRALSYVKPELAITTSDITVTPSSPTAGDSIAITANVRNTGLEGASNITVRLADNGTVIGEQTIASIVPSGTGQASFAIAPLIPTGEHILTVTVDSLNSIDEITKTNNSATTRIWAKSQADLVVLPDYMSISPAYPKPTDSITLTFQIANMGESAANNVAADLYDGNPASGGVKLGSATVSSIAAGGLGNGAITFSLTAAGNHTLTLVADPLHIITETSVTNNTAQKVVSVNATTGTGFIDLTIPMNGLSITPQRPRSGDTVSVTLLTENLGSEAAAADVELFDGNPVAGGTQLYKSTITLNAGESRTLSVPWQIPSGVRTLYAYIDRTNAVIERDETNNSRQLAVMADMVVTFVTSLIDPDLAGYWPMDGIGRIIR